MGNEQDVDKSMDSLEIQVGRLLRTKHLTLGTVESATGGLIAHRITDVPGSSDYFQGSVVSYSNEIKINVVGVRKETIDSFGAVSSQTAEEMAAGGRKLLSVDICVADTGIAGPGGDVPGKPVGLFYIGLSHGTMTVSRKHNFPHDREGNKQAAAETALRMVKDYLESLP